MLERLRIPGVGYAWMIAGVLWLWTFWACAGEWLNTEAYSYGVFVPLLAGYFFWRRWREMEPAEPSKPEARCGWALLWILVFCAAPLELLRQTPLYWRPILWMMGAEAAAATLVAAFLTGGRRAVGGMLFPACFPLMGIPWPGLVETGTTLVLQGWVALATGEILNWLGVAAVVEGKIIRVTQCVLGVEEACSGLQGLQSSLMVALAGGEVFRRGVRTRLALVAWGVGVALAGNLVRAVILGLIGARSGPERVEHWHHLLGVGILLAVVLVVWRAASRRRESKQPELGAKKRILNSKQDRLVGALALAWLLLSGGLVHAWYARPQVAGTEPLLLLGQEVVREEVPPEVAGVLRPTHGSYLRGEGTVGYHFWWAPSRGNANQLYHRPDVCMPGAGWRQSGATREMVLKLQGRESVWTAFPYERPGQEAVLLWAVWLDGQPLRLRAYDQNRQVYLQRELLAEFVRRGKRIFSFEVAACLVPGRDISPSEAAQHLSAMFRWREGAGNR